MTTSPGQGKLGEVFPTSSDEAAWVDPAPALNQPGPELEILEDNPVGGIRTLRLRLLSPRGAWAVMANVEALGAILAGELFGKEFSRETPRDSLFI